MAALSGTIVASRIVPSDSLDAYATHDADYGRGGYRSVADITERDAIPDPRRKVGMKVWVNSESKEYQLIADITNGSWVEVTGGSGSSTIASLTDVVITAPTASQVLSYDEATSKWINTAATSSGGTWGSITGTLSIQTDLQTALDGKEPANANIQSHISSTSNPHSVTAAQVGLGNVDNTSDLNKPISIATQTALDLKAEVDDTTPTTTKVFSSDKTMELHNAQAQAIANKVDKIGANDIEVTDATKGVILKSANGTRFRITIADDGSLTTTAV